MNLIFAYGSLVNRKEIERTLKKVGDEKDYVVLGLVLKVSDRAT